MPHSKALIDTIAILLQVDYPKNAYVYVIEKSIPNTRYFPDIQIYDASGKLVCVVEIGYTRPEKLTAYSKKLKVPDIRWYAKDGKLHTPLARETTICKMSFEDPEWECSVYASDWLGFCECHPPARDDPDEPEDFGDEYEWKYENVTTYVLTDHYARIYVVKFCDRCGETVLNESEWFNESTEFELIKNHSEIGGEFSRIKKGTWIQCATMLKDMYETEPLNYDDAFVLNAQEQRILRRKVTS